MYYKMELQQLQTKGKRDPGYLDSKKKPEKKKDYMVIYEKLCQGKESRVRQLSISQSINQSSSLPQVSGTLIGVTMNNGLLSTYGS